MIKRILATIALIIAVTFFAPPAFASINSSNPDSTVITGKDDIVNASLPLFIYQTAKSSDNTWGRVVRLSGFGNFFDIGIDEQGNFFINSPEDTKTSHALKISPTGVVTIPGK
ncbi:hypothetical protein [Brasilonema bromeliae]|nr:hypothetical protein [Brasilonema bromeliae]